LSCPAAAGLSLDPQSASSIDTLFGTSSVGVGSGIGLRVQSAVGHNGFGMAVDFAWRLMYRPGFATIALEQIVLVHTVRRSPLGFAGLFPKPIAPRRFASIPSNDALVMAFVGGIVPALMAISHGTCHQLFHNHRQMLLVIKRQIGCSST